jgi:hypothetical protein
MYPQLPYRIVKVFAGGTIVRFDLKQTNGYKLKKINPAHQVQLKLSEKKLFRLILYGLLTRDGRIIFLPPQQAPNFNAFSKQLLHFYYVRLVLIGRLSLAIAHTFIGSIPKKSGATRLAAPLYGVC